MINVTAEMVSFLKAVVNGNTPVITSSYSRLRWSGEGKKIRERKFSYLVLNQWDASNAYLSVGDITIHGTELLDLPKEFFTQSEWVEFNTCNIKRYMDYVECLTRPFNTVKKLTAMGIAVPPSML